jgi:hypothetical protein
MVVNKAQVPEPDPSSRTLCGAAKQHNVPMENRLHGLHGRAKPR